MNFRTLRGGSVGVGSCHKVGPHHGFRALDSSFVWCLNDLGLLRKLRPQLVARIREVMNFSKSHV